MYKIDWEEGTGTGAITADVDVGATGDYWANSVSKSWGTQRAAQCATNLGTPVENTAQTANQCTADSIDHKFAAEATVDFSTSGFKLFDITSLASADENDSLNLILIPVSPLDVLIGTSENTNGNDRPYFRYIYTAGGGGGGGAAPSRRKREGVHGNIKEKKNEIYSEYLDYINCSNIINCNCY